MLILGMGSLGTSQGPQAQKKLYGSGLMKSHEWRTRNITQLIMKARSLSCKKPGLWYCFDQFGYMTLGLTLHSYEEGSLDRWLSNV